MCWEFAWLAGTECTQKVLFFVAGLVVRLSYWISFWKVSIPLKNVDRLSSDSLHSIGKDYQRNREVKSSDPRPSLVQSSDQSRY
uniref:Uncharacterized protein n=1 Tax=Utricularia reniformis TaxID=192314 RepID=A0A1Y0AYS6_9LAMI|nr:hypothetical protein AEK19_MT0637 [Utricularia reniformis]ART30297.1 hypothetical protein AEK19_MT0637 [Utricularia reniformis]